MFLQLWDITSYNVGNMLPQNMDQIKQHKIELLHAKAQT